MVEEGLTGRGWRGPKEEEEKEEEEKCVECG
jgi:hypothetical protein